MKGQVKEAGAPFLAEELDDFCAKLEDAMKAGNRIIRTIRSAPTRDQEVLLGLGRIGKITLRAVREMEIRHDLFTVIAKNPLTERGSND